MSFFASYPISSGGGGGGGISIGQPIGGGAIPGDYLLVGPFGTLSQGPVIASLSFGSPVIGGSPQEILYIDNFGNIFGDTSFVRNSVTHATFFEAQGASGDSRFDFQQSHISMFHQNVGGTLNNQINQDDNQVYIRYNNIGSGAVHGYGATQSQTFINLGFSTIAYPTNDGTNQQSLVTNGGGNLSWAGPYLPLSGGVSMTGLFQLSGNAVTGLQPVTLNQLNAITSGVVFAGSVYASTIASDGNHALTGPITADGVAVPNGQDVLLEFQTAPIQNGCWTVNTGGAWTRSSFLPTGANASGRYVAVLFGSTQALTLRIQNDFPAIVDTNPENWTIFSSQTYFAGLGLGLTANTFDVLVDNTTTTINGSNQVIVNAGGITAIQLDVTGVTAGAYTNSNITVDSNGRITSAANGSSSTTINIGAIDGNVPGADGLTFTGGFLYAQSAAVNVPGMVNTLTQHMKGQKYFDNVLTSTVSGSVNASSFSNMTVQCTAPDPSNAIFASQSVLTLDDNQTHSGVIGAHFFQVNVTPVSGQTIPLIFGSHQSVDYGGSGSILFAQIGFYTESVISGSGSVPGDMYAVDAFCIGQSTSTGNIGRAINYYSGGFFSGTGTVGTSIGYLVAGSCVTVGTVSYGFKVDNGSLNGAGSFAFHDDPTSRHVSVFGDFVVDNNLNKISTNTLLTHYASDAAAGVGGLVAGDLYQTSGTGAGVFAFLGVVMTKQ